MTGTLSIPEGSARRGFQLKIVALAGAGVLLDGYDLFIIGIALILLRPYFALDSLQISLLSSSALIGATVGAVLLGNVADRLGRKTLFVFDLIFFVVFAALSAVAQNVWELILFRFFLGIGVGADYPVSSTYVAEFARTERRGRAIASTFAFQGVGVLLAIGVGLALLPLGPDAWRLMLLSGVVPAALVLAFRTRLPETLRWYISKGRKEEAKKVYKEITGVELADSNGMATAAESASFRELFSSPYRNRLLFASLSWFLVDIAVYGMGIYTPTLIRGIFGPNAPPTANEEVYAILYGFAGVGYWIAVLAIDTAGRKLLQAAGFSVMALTLLVAAMVGPAISLGELTLFLAVFYVAQNAGPNTTTWVYPTELFPTRIRGSGHGFAATVGKLGAIVGVFVLPFLERDSESLMLIFVGVAALLGALVTLAYGVETKRRTLEDVSEVFKSFYDYFESMADNLVIGARQLDVMLHDLGAADERYAQVKSTEHSGDELVHEVFTSLNRKMLAPMEQGEISSLTKALDDTLDMIHAVAVRLKLYRITKPTTAMLEFSRIITESTSLINSAIKQLPELRRENTIPQICVRINELENQADSVLNQSVAELFSGSDPIEIIKLKEVYEYLELVTDKCEDVADVLRDLVVKYL